MSGSSENIRINGNNICKSIDKCTFKIYEHGFFRKNHMSAHVAQSAERRLGKAEVVGSIPIVSSSIKENTKR